MSRFIDEARVYAQAGNGGDGAIAFLREKYRPFGGPAGGDGGRGGDVIFEVDDGLSTLLDFKYKPRLIAQNGQPGRGKQQYGHAGADLVVRVPPGTAVFDEESRELLADLVAPRARATIAKAGAGGLGNMHFVSATRRAPRIAKPGGIGERRRIRLELRLVAEAGLIGLPNAGKSTTLKALTAAEPKIAPYPFTTIVPNIGRVVLENGESFTIADIPGLIEGAHLGHGLGTRFLRHLSRTRVLIYVLDLASEPQKDFLTIRGEIEQFDPILLTRPAAIALNKLDLLSAKAAVRIARELKALANMPVFTISAATRIGLAELKSGLATLLGAADQSLECRT
ncbi:MAG: GTPase ObgE [Candidatus Binataceae bacterium]